VNPHKPKRTKSAQQLI